MSDFCRRLECFEGDFCRRLLWESLARDFCERLKSQVQIQIKLNMNLGLLCEVFAVDFFREIFAGDF